MAIYVKVNDQVQGPLSEQEIRERLAKGALTPQSPAWKMGMPEWKTVAELLPKAPPSAPPLLPRPPLLPKSPSEPPNAPSAPILPAEDTNFEQALEFLNAAVASSSVEVQPDAMDRLLELSNRFFTLVGEHFGQIARPNHTFYAYRVALTAIQRLRLDLLKGASLAPKGEEFAGLVAAYLAMLAVLNWRRRGLEVSGCVRFTPGAKDNCLFFFAERTRDGKLETYSHDFLDDMHQVLLQPPQTFPSMHGRFFVMESLTLPSPEYIYQYAVHLMQSSRSGGNWPQSQKVGGLDSDFRMSRELLVNDLHQDCDLPKDDPALRKLSWWVVFPPFGWEMNDGQDYNLMTIFDQISHQKIVPMDVGTDYLRALLRCQSPDIRNLAARALMVYRVPPSNALEAAHYNQSMHSRDWELARGAMAKHQSQLENDPKAGDLAETYATQCQEWFRQTPPVLSHVTAAINDPDYVALTKVPGDQLVEGVARLAALLRRYPDDWVLKMLHASQSMAGPDPRGGEARLRELIKNPPDCCEGHSRLGTMLKRQGRFQESMEVYEDELRRWPWNYRAVDSCLWLITEGMTRF